jgi:hypothetical protein
VLDREEILNSGGSPEQKIQDWKNETDFFQKGPFFSRFAVASYSFSLFSKIDRGFILLEKLPTFFSLLNFPTSGRTWFISA